MSETLVIRLRAAEGAPASWLIVDSNGARSGPVQNGPLGDATGTAHGRRVVVLLPSSDITLAEPELPVRGGARLAQAVPFALEEQLASDVETLHFAIGARTAGSVGTPVAVIARAALERLQGQWDAAGLAPVAAYADSCALPTAATGCTLLLDESLLYVRRANSLPYVLDAEPLPAALEFALGSPEGGEQGEHVTFYTSTAEYERHREVIEGLRARTATLQVKLLPDGPLPLLAAQAVGGAGVNLLQGPYAPRSSMRGRMREWRLPAALAAAVVLVFVVGQALSWWQLRRTEKALDAQIAEVLAQVLPGQPVVDARAQVQGLLGSGGAARGSLLPTLSVLAQAMTQAPNARVESISFRNNVLELSLTAPSVESLDGIKQAVSRDGIAAELLSATPRGPVYLGRLQLKLGQA